MRRYHWFLVIFLFSISNAMLWGVSEIEPNNYLEGNIIQCYNDINYSGILSLLDTDIWKFVGTAGDTIHLDMFCQNHAANVSIESYNHSIFQETFTPSLSRDIVLPEYGVYVITLYNYNQSNINNPYNFTITGLYVEGSITSPTDFSIPDGSINIDPNAFQLSWRWGDYSIGQAWQLKLGTSPLGMKVVSGSLRYITNQNESFSLGTPLAGNMTYYYQLEYSTAIGLITSNNIRSFTTGTRSVVIPEVLNYIGTNNSFISLNPFCPWNEGQLSGTTPTFMSCPEVAGEEGILLESGSYNLSIYPESYIAFRHINSMDPNNDHGYIEYSLDDGNSWTPFPASAYTGSGVYDTPTNNNPEGPCFDAAAYPAWSGTPNLSTGWKEEFFQLSAWSYCQKFRVRFRAEWDSTATNRYWMIDRFTIQHVLPTVAFLTPPQGETYSAINQTFTWAGTNATSYQLQVGTSPNTGTIYTTTEQQYTVRDLSPLTMYYWSVWGINASGSSSSGSSGTLRYFSTQNIAAPTFQYKSAYISRTVIGTQQDTSGWDNCSYHDTPIPAYKGTNLPITVNTQNTSGQDLDISMVIDWDNDGDFYDSDYIAIPSSSNDYTYTLPIPNSLNSGIFRLRLLYIPLPIGSSSSNMVFDVYPYGEVEDYLLDIQSQPLLQVSPSSLLYPNSLVGIPMSPSNFVLSNIGGGSLSISSISLSGADTDCFTLTDTNTYPLELVSNQATVAVSYTPTRAGEHTASLLIEHTMGETSIPLTGTGIGCTKTGGICFDGSNEYVGIPSGAPLQNLSAVTIETWFKWNGNSSVQFVCGKGIEELEIHTSTNNGLRFIPTDQIWLDSNPNVLIPGTWQHIACVYDPSQLLAKIYVDGVDVTWRNNGRYPLSTPLKSTTDSFRLGQRQSSQYLLNGCLDEFRVWKTALSVEQIRNNMHLWVDPTLSTLAGYWRFDETNGTKIWDQKNVLSGQMNNSETTDRIQTPVLLGAGIAKTLNVTSTGQQYDFTNTGVQLSFSTLGASGPVTVTHLTGSNDQQEPSYPSWIIQDYDNATRTAQIGFAIDGGISLNQLPANNFTLYSHAAILNPDWMELSSGNSADIQSGTIFFDQITINSSQYKINWESSTPPSGPSNVQISITDNQVILHWDAVPNAIGYKVYSANDLAQSFSADESGTYTDNSWTAPATATTKFYWVVSIMPN